MVGTVTSQDTYSDKEKMEIKIVLNETEYNALLRVCTDPQEWAENAVKERARIAIEDIVSEQVRNMISNPDVSSIPATIEEIIATAPAEQAEELPTS